jgi:hypothetical protein
MGTRAVYFFYDEDFQDLYGVYKHYDNYPSGAASHIEAAKEYAWQLPRFEADEFAAAFVAANKNPNGGECRLIGLFNHDSVPSVMEEQSFCDYYYYVSYSQKDEDLKVEILESNYDEELEETIWRETGRMTHSVMKRGFEDG